MSVNLLDLVHELMGKDVVSQLGGVLGENTEKTQAALNSAIPALLGGLINKASSPNGAEELMRALDDQDAGLQDNLPALLSGQNLDAIMSQGSRLLESIFGANFKSVLDVLGRSVGLGGKSTSSLLAILAPVVMSVLKQQRSTLGLGVDGLVKLLQGQTEFLRGKLPEGLGELIGLARLTDKAVARPGSTPAPSGAAAAEPTPPQAGGSWLSRLLPLIALVALAAIAWQLLTQRPDTDRIIDQEIDESVLVPGTGDTKLQGPPRDESLE